MNCITKTTVASFALAASLCGAVEPVPENVPDLLTAFDGGKIATREQWEKVRRPELLARFERDVFGRRPAAAEKPKERFKLVDAHANEVMGGRAVRKKMCATVEGPYGKCVFNFAAFIPKSSKPVPAFLLICNRSLDNIDPDRAKKTGYWSAEEIVARGYAAISFCNVEVAPDDIGSSKCADGVFAALEKWDERTPESWATISAWAWAASRIMDWIETEKTIDAKHVAVVGHSRGGKTALWAGATDKRFALVCSNDSGCSGAKLNHIELPDSESIDVISATNRFAYWFCGNYRQYAGREKEMDFDQHELVALIAPRLVAIASATEDSWAGPVGEWWSGKLASPAWELYGLKGLVADAWPAPETPQQKGCISYHLRVGKHGLMRYDWKCYMDFADAHGWTDRSQDTPLDMRWFQYEPRDPYFDEKVNEVGGFKGRHAALVRLNGANAVGDESNKTWRATAWRNERAYAQFVAWADEDVGQLRMSVSDLAGPGGATIPSAAVKARFLRHVLSRLRDISGVNLSIKETLEGDCLDDSEKVDLPAFTYRPMWLVVNVPKDAAPGLYKGVFKVTGTKSRTLEFPLELTVLAETLPDPKDWAYFLDLWQHPWAVARYHGVKPFSPAHYALLEPLLKELANGGQKTITTTITDLPWNHQNYDSYYTMVEHVKRPDGTWTHDYSLFDEYVEFSQKCGLGPQIHCYTMASWGNIVYYVDGATSDKVAVELKAGTPEHEAFWGPFLVDFQKHLAAKGWLGRTYIALDERSREELMAAANIIKRYGPGLKLQMAGNKMPSTFTGITVDNYSQAFRNDWITPEYLKEVRARREAGHVTTFYICCSPLQPNSFTYSPFAEQQSLGVYAAAQGLDGMLRWAVFNWPRDPFFDSSFKNWRPGDTYLFYPGARTSVRWEMIRDGIELNEKIRLLRAEGRASTELESALKNLDLSVYNKGKEADFRRMVDAVSALVDASSRK